MQAAVLVIDGDVAHRVAFTAGDAGIYIQLYSQYADSIENPADPGDGAAQFEILVHRGPFAVFTSRVHHQLHQEPHRTHPATEDLPEHDAHGTADDDDPTDGHPSFGHGQIEGESNPGLNGPSPCDDLFQGPRPCFDLCLLFFVVVPRQRRLCRVVHFYRSIEINRVKPFRRGDI